jgi:hypothetical protein
MNFDLPRIFRDEMRNGPVQPWQTQALRAHKFSRDGGERAYEYEWDMAMARRVTGAMARQGWNAEKITRAHFNKKNRGFVAVRFSDDARAVSAKLIAEAYERNAGRPPMLLMKDRDARIENALAGGVMLSQKALIKAVGTAIDGHTVDDLVRLTEAGALGVVEEQHGQVTWKKFFLAVTPAAFREISRQSRLGIAQIIRQRKSQQKRIQTWLGSKGCKVLIVDKGSDESDSSYYEELERLERIRAASPSLDLLCVDFDDCAANQPSEPAASEVTVTLQAVTSGVSSAVY